MEEVTVEIVQQLIQEQFPKWQNLPIRKVAKNGHDNYTFHLGDTMTVRLPSGKEYEAQVEKENRWLPYLQEYVTYPISKPLAIGKPSSIYPFFWSIHSWIEGDTLDAVVTIDTCQLAKDLALYLKQLQAIDTKDGPMAGAHNFYRGGSLTIYHQETLDALAKLKDIVPVERLLKIWNRAIASIYQGTDVWVHGDIAPGNLLIKDGKLSGIIDFGILGVGDPSCDYAMAWTYFDQESRTCLFLDSGHDKDMFIRAKGWALWKALITYTDDNLERRENAKRTIEEILQEENSLE